MIKRIIFVVLLCLPWGFFVTAADFLWGNALGYLLIPAITWWSVWRLGRHARLRWLVFGLIVSYMLSMTMTGYIDGAWDYFFKPFNQSIVMNIWTIVFASGVGVAYVYRWAFEKTRMPA